MKYITTYGQCIFLIDDKANIIDGDIFLLVDIYVNINNIYGINSYNPDAKKIKIIWYYDKSINYKDSKKVVYNNKFLLWAKTKWLESTDITSKIKHISLTYETDVEYNELIVLPKPRP